MFMLEMPVQTCISLSFYEQIHVMQFRCYKMILQCSEHECNSFRFYFAFAHVFAGIKVGKQVAAWFFG